MPAKHLQDFLTVRREDEKCRYKVGHIIVQVSYIERRVWRKMHYMLGTRKNRALKLGGASSLSSLEQLLFEADFRAKRPS